MLAGRYNCRCNSRQRREGSNKPTILSYKSNYLVIIYENAVLRTVWRDYYGDWEHVDFGAIRSISVRWFVAMLFFFFMGHFYVMSFVDDDQGSDIIGSWISDLEFS